jgi:hypothetical protein
MADVRRDSAPAGTRKLLALCAVLCVAAWVPVAFDVGEAGARFFATWLFNALLVICAMCCLWCARARSENRVVPAMIGAGLIADALGGLTATVLERGGDLPVPSLADPLWLAIYPCEYVALLVLARQRGGVTGLATKLDGLLSGLAIASVVVCLTLPPALADSGDSPLLTKFTNILYPIADLILLGAVVSVVAVNGWRLDRQLAVLATGVLAWEAADLIYLIRPRSLDGFGDPLVLAGVTMLAVAVTQWGDPPRSGQGRRDGAFFLTLAVGLLPLGVLVLAQPLDLIWPGVVLAGCAVLIVFARMVITMRQNERIIGSNEREIVARDQAQEELRTSLEARGKLDEQMRDMLQMQSDAEKDARHRASALLDATTQLLTGPLHNVVAQVEAVRNTATSIESQVAAADQATTRVVDQARETDSVMLALTESLSRVRSVAASINRVANQTNLLALNATIESARAGEAGMGFSVVANEVKDLSRDTSRFAEEITATIGSLRNDAAAVAESIKGMAVGITDIGSSSALIREVVTYQRDALLQLNKQAEAAATQARRIGDSSASGDTR